MIKGTGTKNHNWMGSVLHPGNGGTCSAGPILGESSWELQSCYLQRVGVKAKKGALEERGFPSREGKHFKSITPPLPPQRCVCVLARACVCPTEGQHISHKHCGSRALQDPYKECPLTPSIHKVTDAVNFAYIANASLNNSLLLRKVPLD